MNFYYLLQAIESYYGQGSPQWMQVASGSVSPAEFASILKQLPNVNVVFNQDGTVRSYDALTPINKQYLGSTTASSINSNISSTTKTSVSVPTNTTTTTTSTGTTVVEVEQGVKIATETGTAAATAVRFDSKKAVNALFAVGLLISMGKIVTPELYENLPDIFKDEELSNYDPDTWKKLTAEKNRQSLEGTPLLASLLNVFNDGSNKAEIYLDLDAAAYLLKYYISKGIFTTSVPSTDVIIGNSLSFDSSREMLNSWVSYILSLCSVYTSSSTWWCNRTSASSEANTFRLGALTDAFHWLRDNAPELPDDNSFYCISMYNGTSGLPFEFTFKLYILEKPSNVIYCTDLGSAGYGYLLTTEGEPITYNMSEALYFTILNTDNVPTYSFKISSVNSTGYYEEPVTSFESETGTVHYQPYYDSYVPCIINDVGAKTTNNIFIIDSTVEPTSDVEGIDTEEGATVPTFTGDESYEDIKTKLQTEFPDLFDKEITQSVVQPDGSVVEYRYIPIVMPTPNPNPTEGTDPEEEPVSGDQRQADIEIDPETTPETVTEYVILTTTETPDPNIEDTGEGETPAVIVPTGSAEALYKVWNPTQEQLNNFGAWLWSSSFVDQLLKVFNDPMQAIIGLHKVFATPSVGGTDTITVGYLDSGVSSNYIDSQYVTVDCGTVSFPEDYNNVFDYTPFTDVTLYLPFIGFVRLDVNDIARSTIGVIYHVDVLTGACLAEVSVTRDLAGGVLYTYSGNCSVTYPLSSGSYMGIVGTIASIAGGIAGTLATGGAAAPMMLGAAAGALNAHTNVERSGSLSGNSGAMGIKTPYLVISRPQTNLANSFESFLGKPANYTTTLSSASGFVSCTDVHLVNCNATDNETAEIESLLKSGIII